MKRFVKALLLALAVLFAAVLVGMRPALLVALALFGFLFLPVLLLLWLALRLSRRGRADDGGDVSLEWFVMRE